jgi:hypothetical protein
VSSRRLLLALGVAGVAACVADGQHVAAPAPVEPLFQYELRAATVPAEACRRPHEAPECARMLVLARREGAARTVASAQPLCCWQCVSGLNTCGQEHWPGRPVALGAHTFPAGGRCEPALASDFEGEGQTALRLYLDWLVRTYGPPYVHDPAEVALSIPASFPRPTEVGVTAGEVSCTDGKDAPAFQITLFRAALEGRPRQSLYGALAHEFFHVVQIRRDGLACKPTRDTKERLEREAEEAARKIVPPCK